MKIDQFGNIKESNPVKKRLGVSQAGAFSSLLGLAETEETAQSAQTSNISASSDISTILALQEMPEEEIRRKKLIKHGDNMLDSLDQLRRRLLMGTIPENMLNEINQQLSQQRQEVSDPRLLAIIDDIELRTAVELAKLEMAFASRSKLE